VTQKEFQNTYFAIHLKGTNEKENVQGEKHFQNGKCLQKKKKKIIDTGDR